MKYREQFELAVVFGTPGLLCPPGGLKIGPNGKYLRPDMRAAYAGFAAGYAKHERQLKCFEPDRYLSLAMEDVYLAAVGKASPFGASTWIREALRVCRAMPCG